MLVEQVAQLGPSLPPLQGLLEKFCGGSVGRLGLEIAPVVPASGVAIAEFLVVHADGDAHQRQHLVGVGQLVVEELVEQLAQVTPATQLGS